MKKLLMVLAMGLTLSSVGLAREPNNFNEVSQAQVVREFGESGHARAECRRGHRRHHHHHRHFWRF